MANELIPCYIARCLCGCGALRFASVDEPGQSEQRRKDTAKDIKALIASGNTVERSTVGEVRSARWRCASETA